MKKIIIVARNLIKKINGFINEMIKNIMAETPYIILLKNSSFNSKFNLRKYCFEKNSELNPIDEQKKNHIFNKLAIKTSSIKICKIT